MAHFLGCAADFEDAAALAVDPRGGEVAGVTVVSASRNAPGAVTLDLAVGAVQSASARVDVGGCCDAVGVPWDLLALDTALRASWAADTCSADDVARAGWQPANPAWGHCDITALVVHDLFGGDLVVGEVWLNGEQQGFHWWNRLPSGAELDLTREQFQLGQSVTASRIVERPPGPPRRRATEYLLLRERLSGHLGPLPGPVSASSP